ncbi:nuclear transport factor 2 family protein [Chryseobacterium sp.]|uniref:nuclear transport factor 2 family protein n=1 Tax=Chryseobacterium sp. TaxID=1871047 RepID=UPI0025BDC0D7|nr:nuclear transport factor 2 family protein [Chryseobacterium sp.]
MIGQITIIAPTILFSIEGLHAQQKQSENYNNTKIMLDGTKNVTILDQQTREIIEEFYSVQSGKKRGNLTELFAEVVDFDLPGNMEKFPWTGKRNTKKEVEDFFKILYENVKSEKFDVEFISVNGENAVAVGQLSSVILKYNKVFNTQFAAIFKVRNGKIVKYHFMEDNYRLNEEMQ